MNNVETAGSNITEDEVGLALKANGGIEGLVVDVGGAPEVLVFAYERLILTDVGLEVCLLYTSPSPRDQRGSRMPSSA